MGQRLSMPAQAMATATLQDKTPKAARVDGKARKLAHAYITKLKSRGDRFLNLRMRAATVEFTTLDEGGLEYEHENEISIHAEFRKPCDRAKAQLAFKDLIEKMELAGYRSTFEPDELFRPELKTPSYILYFRKKGSGN